VRGVRAPGEEATKKAVTVSTRVRVRVEGIVQGVGFRPFVFRLAEELGLGGFVGNDAAGVVIEAEGLPEAVDRLVATLREAPPPLAIVEAVRVAPLGPVGETGFSIATSEGGGQRQTLISPDVATCADCLAEVADPGDRRYRYPFTNCTNCGPRFTITRDVPYDRPNTTMAAFDMCAACAAEYEDPRDRRYHAQPVCCPACGPRLAFYGKGDNASGEAALTAAATALAQGAVVAIKGLGGYHLAALAHDDDAVATLRARKHREDKPFALMVADATDAARLCHVDEHETALLTSPRAPIVLLARRGDAPVAHAVAPGNRELGVMLPYTPLHHLLLGDVGAPIVLTSGNMSDEPIAYLDDEAARRLAPIADAFLTHDRPIHMRVDDSVARVVRGEPMLLRRARGYAPQPIPLAHPCPRPALACGAELKHTFALAQQRRAVVSHHIGDLENYETLRSFTEGVAHYTRLFDIVPQVVAHDLHPEYLSTKHAGELDAVELAGVQHHHAHIASCLADNGRAERVIGVAFDGIGLGTDDTIWGGEILAADLTGFERTAFLDPVPLPGATTAIRQPWRMAAAWLDAAYDGQPPNDLDVVTRNHHQWADVLAVARSGVNSPPTSSMGRLFDAVAALAGVRDTITYEGQAAVELEQRADPGQTAAYPLPVDDAEAPLRLRAREMIAAIVEDLRAGRSAATVAGRFHAGVAAAVTAVCRAARERTGLSSVALSGGVFQNRLLAHRCADELERAGFEVLLHRRVPPNDGGISLGQLAVAAARDRQRFDAGDTR
jgi:hydrogenase maturation protein HypF